MGTEAFIAMVEEDIPNPHFSIQDVDREHYFGSKGAAAQNCSSLQSLSSIISLFMFLHTALETFSQGERITTEAFDLQHPGLKSVDLQRVGHSVTSQGHLLRESLTCVKVPPN